MEICLVTYGPAQPSHMLMNQRARDLLWERERQREKREREDGERKKREERVRERGRVRDIDITSSW